MGHDVVGQEDGDSQTLLTCSAFPQSRNQPLRDITFVRFLKEGNLVLLLTPVRGLLTTQYGDHC